MSNENSSTITKIPQSGSINFTKDETIRSIITAKNSERYDIILMSDKINCKKENSSLPDGCATSRYIKYTTRIRKSSINLEFSYSALNQILNKIKIPAIFYRKCTIDLQRNIFNHFKKSNNTNCLFRMDPRNGYEGEYVRAVLSNKYGIIDDTQLFPIVLDMLNEDKNDISYRSFKWDNSISQLSIVFNSITAKYDNRSYTAGIKITNSETGFSSVWVEPVVFLPRYNVVNRQALQSQGLDARIIHRGELNETRLQQMISRCKEISQVGILQIAESWTTEVVKDDALKFIKEVDSLPIRFHNMLEEEWKSKDTLMQAQVTERIIQLAQRLPLFQRIQAEQEAGRFIGLFNSYQQRIDDMMNEILIRQEDD